MTAKAARHYFDRHARRFDRIYETSNVATRLLRSGPLRGRDLAVSVVSQRPGGTVLDVGCGPGRVAEAVLEAGATTYLGIDVSPRMLALAHQRLARFNGVELVEGDVLGVHINRTFDVVLALGLFEYLSEPVRVATWMRARCSATLVASFTRWELLKGPARHLHYAFRRCPIADYTEEDAQALLHGVGFSSVDFPFRGRRGFLVSADVPSEATTASRHEDRARSAAAA